MQDYKNRRVNKGLKWYEWILITIICWILVTLAVLLTGVIAGFYWKVLSLGFGVFA